MTVGIVRKQRVGEQIVGVLDRHPHRLFRARELHSVMGPAAPSVDVVRAELSRLVETGLIRRDGYATYGTLTPTNVSDDDLLLDSPSIPAVENEFFAFRRPHVGKRQYRMEGSIWHFIAESDLRQRPIARISRPLVLAWCAGLANQTTAHEDREKPPLLSPWTQHHLLVLLRAFLDWAKTRGWVEWNVCDGIQIEGAMKLQRQRRAAKHASFNAVTRPDRPLGDRAPAAPEGTVADFVLERLAEAFTNAFAGWDWRPLREQVVTSTPP